MADPIDMIIPMLREMRAENAALHEQTRALIQALDKRLGAVESAQNSYRTPSLPSPASGGGKGGGHPLEQAGDRRVRGTDRDTGTQVPGVGGAEVIDLAQLGRAIGGGRVLCREIGCVLSHLRTVTTQPISVGALTPSSWAFEERVTP